LPACVGVSVGAGSVAEGVGVGDCVGAATGQVTREVFVYTGCAGACVVTAGDGASVADEGEVADVLGLSVRVGCVLVTTGSALGRHLPAEAGDFAPFGVRDTLEAPPVLLSPLGTGPAGDVPVPPSTDRVPLPSVPAAV